jgi:NADPH2:quinone reductase
VRAIQITEFGGPEVLTPAELPDPQPRRGQVLIEVAAAGVNYADTHQTENTYLMPMKLPLVPGAEAVGSTPDGRRVVALLANGGYAEKVVAREQAVFEVPEGVEDAQALALVLQGTTAWHLLRTSARLARGESVVVSAAAGGVGSIAVQLAKAWGAGRVIALASTERKRELALSLGADAAVDPAEGDLTRSLEQANGGGQVDVVLEMTGGRVTDACLAALAPFGRLAYYGTAGRRAPPSGARRHLPARGGAAGPHRHPVAHDHRQARPGAMKLVTWNVNSLKARLPRVLEFLAEHRPDVLCMQETKVGADAFPHAELAGAGYTAVDHSAGRWAGVAIAAPTPVAPVLVACGLPGEVEPEQARWVEADVAGLRVTTVYVPNGRAVGTPTFEAKLAFLDAMRARIGALLDGGAHPLVVVGDMNIAPTDLDVYDPPAFATSTHVTPDERGRLRDILDLGLVDAFRQLAPERVRYTWWDYRAGHFPKNYGLRIDLALLSDDLVPALRACDIVRDYRKGSKPSDHAPLLVELDR